MDIFNFRNQLISDYSSYVNSFIHIRDPRLRGHVDESLAGGALWPESLIQLNPSFEPGGWIDDLVAEEALHEECSRIFRIKKERNGEGRPLKLHRHQADAIHVARGGNNYVLTTGTASGKSLSYIAPVVDHVLRNRSRGIQAIVVYPMNALANSQFGELKNSSATATRTAKARLRSSATPARNRMRSVSRSSPTRRTSCSPTT